MCSFFSDRMETHPKMPVKIHIVGSNYAVAQANAVIKTLADETKQAALADSLALKDISVCRRSSS